MTSISRSRNDHQSPRPTKKQWTAWIALLLAVSAAYSYVLLSIIGKMPGNTIALSISFWSPIMAIGVFQPVLIRPEEIHWRSDLLLFRFLWWLVLSAITVVVLLNVVGMTLGADLQ